MNGSLDLLQPGAISPAWGFAAVFSVMPEKAA
jgi:hypothetical protein